MIQSRRPVQVLALAVFVVAVLVPPGLATMGRTGHPFFHADPYLALLALLGSGSIPLATLVGSALLLALTVTRGALFCRSFCPMGTLQDAIPHARRRTRPGSGCTPEPVTEDACEHQQRVHDGRVNDAPTGAAHGNRSPSFRIRPWLLAALLVLGGMGIFPAGILDPLSIIAQGVLALHGVGTAAAGLGAVTVLPLAALVLIILAAGLETRPFCRHVCPLGETLLTVQRIAAAARVRRPAVGAVARRALPPRSTGLPSIAATAQPHRAPPPAVATPAAGCCSESGGGLMGRAMTRRGFLGAAAAVPVGALLRESGASTTPLRPPGALAEREFIRSCIRCGQCVAACPTGCIVPSWFEGGLAGLLSPRLALSRAPCLPGCTACQDVCPSGALKPLAAARRREWKIGLARVRADRCLRSAGKDCQVCRDVCPYNALAYAPGASPSLPRLEPDLCVGCGICQNACPARGAIIVDRGGLV